MTPDPAIMKKHWPLFGAWTLFLLCVAALAAASLHVNNGHFGYVIDDAYVHMAVGKQFAQHGIWGVTPYAFSFSTSSVLWPLALSGCYRLFGVNDVAPFLLNTLFGILVLYLAYLFLLDQQKPWHRPFVFFVLVGIVLLTPLPTLAFVGMEHSLQTLMTLLVAYLAVTCLADDRERAGSKKPATMMALIFAMLPLVVLVRYEGLFLAGVLCVLLALRRRWLVALSFLIMAILPVCILGFVSVQKGSLWLPLAGLMNAQTFRGHGVSGVLKLFGGHTMINLWKFPHVLVLLATGISLFAMRFGKSRRIWEENQILLLLFVAVTLLQTQFASLGWFYRYEAYLVCFGLLAISKSIWAYFPDTGLLLDKGMIPQYIALGVLFLLLSSPLVFRGFVAMVTVPQGTKNIYDQNVQMGLFLKTFYEGETVAINDLGAANYIADFHCVDLYGIGTADVARMKVRSGKWLSAEEMREIAQSKGFKIAILQGWFEQFNAIPKEWVPVGEWEITNLASSANPRTIFFAIEDSEKGNLMTHLRHFAAELPPDVIQRGAYLDPS